MFVSAVISQVTAVAVAALGPINNVCGFRVFLEKVDP